jgi:hypothetical protein
MTFSISITIGEKGNYKVKNSSIIDNKNTTPFETSV